MLPAPNPVAPHRCITSRKKVSLLNNGRVNTCIRYLQEIDERCPSSWIMCIKGLVYLLSHNCHLNMDCDVLTAHCRSSSGDSVVPLWLLVIGVSRTLLKSNTTLRSHLGVDHLIFDGGGGGGCANPPKKYRAYVSD